MTTLLEQLTAGPRWVAWTPLGDDGVTRIPEPEARRLQFNGRISVPPCCACCEVEWTDLETGLCRPCWRAWRFSIDAIRAEAGDERTVKR